MKERVWTFIEALARFQLTLQGFRSTEYQQKNLMILGATWNVSLVGTCIFNVVSTKSRERGNSRERLTIYVIAVKVLKVLLIEIASYN